MGDHAYKKKESSAYDVLNMLVYDYLMKMNYEGSAKMFCSEAGLGEFKSNEGAPVLAQWYSVFHEISAVRSGFLSNSQDLARIEGIMMRLENEKRRQQQIGKMDGAVGGYGRGMDAYKRQSMPYQQQYDQRKIYGQQTPPSSEGMSGFYDPRKQMPGGYRMPHMSTRQNWFDEQNTIGSKPSRRHVDERSDVLESSMGHTLAERQHTDGSIGLKEVMCFVPGEATIICSAVAQEHKMLIVSFSSKTIMVVNLLSGKTESMIETIEQVHDMKIKEYEDQVVIVCGIGGNDLLILRCEMKGGVHLEISNVLKGHNAPIVSYEVLDFIHSLDSAGIMRKWNMNGVFEREEVLSGDIAHICCISEDNFMFADKNRVYVYDFELNIEMMEILKGQVTEIKRIKEGFIIVFNNQAIWLDKRVQKVKTLSINEGVKTAALIDGNLVVASFQNVWFNNGKSLSRVKLHDTNVIGLECVNVFRKSSIVSCSAGGECKMLVKCLED
ncbi:hypothetical protein CWI42_041990 [Ordospora colligata]|uniref:Uncharacterized protein n=1 Tax=Ordospora colligata OC4 TaxID=1354746 RepID=A0A0B2ULY0_9MICR|nr:uncharacterized protein M896_042000 [Ordospora colligata OC4]KHN70000.1 hypothetical protein M896_042000 [Ordospora colligata OC4]TBU16170.1 hypothetical protein CWI41_041990 [Ordospora colligata]TBU16383.1 hypothetical protein CWI40_041990 [Ordospora colligata]TBU19087.1 hypothetical protein CWI42_041990 [Ordospora colligata]